MTAFSEMAVKNRKVLSFSLRAPLRTPVLAVLVAVVSYIACVLGHSIVLSYQGVSVLWPACAFLVSVLMLVPRRTWPVLIPAGVAGFVVNDLQFGFSAWTIARLNAADTIEVLIVCLGLGYCFDGVPRLNSLKAFAKYCFFAVILGPFVSAFLIAAAIPGSYLINWRIWFFSQALAFLTLTPAICSWASANHRFRGSIHSKVEAAALIGGLAILGYFVLLIPWKTMPSWLIYSFVPFLLWAAWSFGSMGVSTSMIVISFLSIRGAIHGHGPFAGPQPFEDVLSLQLFLIFAAIPFMVLAAMAEEREQDRKALWDASRRLIEAHEEERKRIARELHDDYSQRLAIVALELQTLAENGSPSSGEADERVHKLIDCVGELGGDLHALSHRLHSSTLETLGLVAGVRAFCKEFEVQQGVLVDFVHNNIPSDIPSDVALCVFRVTQEALRNVKKHSGAGRAEVRLEQFDRKLHLSVSDHGRGFDPLRSSPKGGIGFHSMEERLRLLGGKLEIQTRHMGGTRLDAWLPSQRR